MRTSTAAFLVACIGLVLVPQVGSAQPAYNRSVNSVSVYPYTGPLPKANPTTETAGAGFYMVAATGAFTVAEAASHDLSSRLRIMADGILVAEYSVEVDTEGADCYLSTPPNCQSSLSCGPVIIGDQQPYNWLGISFQGCCEIVEDDNSSYCGCCTIYEETTTGAFGPFNLDPGSEIEVRVDSYSTGEAEIYTADDAEFAVVPQIVPTSSLKSVFVLLTFLVVFGGLAVLQRRRRRLA